MSQSVAREPRPRTLWHDANFLRFWGGQTSAQFGAQVAELALPVIAVLALHATEFEIGALNAAGLAAFLIVGLPAGAWIDRMRKRRVMIVADMIRAGALTFVPLLWWAGRLETWHLMVIAAVMGVATVFFDVSYQSLIPALVPRERISEANGKLEATSQLAGIAGPAAGGWLIGILTAPFAMLAAVATYLISFIVLCLTRDHERMAPTTEHEPLPRAIAEGLRWVFGNRYLRRIVGTTAVSNFFGTITFTLLPLLLLRNLGFSPAQLGLVFGISSVGGLVGALATPHLVRLVGEARAIPIATIAFALCGLLVPVSAMVPAIALPLLIAQGFIGMASTVAYNVTQVSFRQRITSARLLGRMNASIRFIVWGVMPLSALAAGALASTIGVVMTMWIGAVGGLTSAAFVVTGPFWALRHLPGAE